MGNRQNKSNDDTDSVASLDSTGKRKSFRRLCERFAEKTSMQGIPYIHMAKLAWAKLIWTLLLLGAIAGMVYHLKFLIANYTEFEKSTKIELGRDNLRFPAVTICNTNIIKQRSLDDLEGAKLLKELVHDLKPENYGNTGTNQGGTTGPDQGGTTGPNQGGNTGPNQGGNTGPNTRQGRTGQETTPPPTTTKGADARAGGSDFGGATDNSTRRPQTSPPSDGQNPPPEGQSPSPDGSRPPRVRRQQPQPNNNNNNNNYQPPSEHRPPLYDFNISKYDPNFNDELEDVVLDDDEYDNPLDVQSQVYNLFTELYMDLTKKNRAQIGHNISEMLVACSFGERICDYRLFRLRQTAEYGNCWTITSKKFVSMRPGPSGGLELVLFLQTDEYLKGITNGYGIRLVVHHPETFPFPYDEGIFVPAAMETNIGLRLRTITRIGLPHGECNEGVDFKEKLKFSYTRQACQVSCIIFKVLDTCGCFEDGTEEIAISQIKDAHPCRTPKEERCMVQLLRKFQKNEETCTCLNPCHEVEYLQALSQRQWPSDDYAQILLQSACHLDETGCTTLQSRDNRLLNYNFLKLNIYYEDLNYENVTESPDIETVQFLSDVGGAIGLWIGLSLLSLCELGQLFIELFVYCVDRTRHSGERTERKREKQKNKKLREMDHQPKNTETNNSRGVLNLPDIKYDLENGSGRGSSHDNRHDNRFRDSPNGSPHERRFKGDRSPRGSPRGSPWLERRGREEFGMRPPTRFYNEY